MLGNAFVYARPTRTTFSSADFVASGNVLADGYIYGEEWSSVGEDANTWTTTIPESNIWTTRTPGTNTWLQRG